MAVIEQLDPVYVLFTQPNAEVLRFQAALATGRLKKSAEQSVELILEDGRPYGHKGRLLTRDMSVDPTTGAITLKAEFPNAQRLLLPGTFVRVRLPQGVAAAVVKVPQRAVLSGAQGQFVLLVDEENKVTPRPVKVGSMAGADFVIEEGLEGGETLIVGGVQKARPGTVVKPVAARPAS
jgi:membrane fusion protein (multidrug efflux system)